MVSKKIFSYKRGITYIEVILSLFIFVMIMSIVYPFVKASGSTNLDRESSKIVSILKLCKSRAIGEGSNIRVGFSDIKNGGYTGITVYKNREIIDSYKLSDDFCLKVSESDLNGGYIVFRRDGTLDHRATTLNVLSNKNNESSKITLTIGYTRIMRIE